MTFKEIWAQLCRKQPALQNPQTTVEFTSENLQSLLKQVYEQGKKSQPASSTSSIESLFGSNSPFN